MKQGWRCIGASIVLLLAASTSGFAHRLDEYLQATTFSISPDHIAMRMRLASGIAVASRVLTTIDRDGNGSISDVEERAYAQRVINDLSLQIDGRAAQLQFISGTFATVDALKAGLGDIVLEFAAVLLPGSSVRTLTFENHHQRAIAVYLVNALVPRDQGVHVSAQDRNYNQSWYQLHFALDGSARAPDVADAATPQEFSLDRSDRWAVLRTYGVHGVRHILTGYDHLLFAIALVLAATTLSELVKVVTAFTIAHSITLALAALGLAHLPEHVVEPIIAASIVFVAVQNIFWSEHAYGWSRLLVAFLFGLFHGLAFAGGLLDLMQGMQPSTVLLAVLGFSVGVEAGHQIVLLPLFAGLMALRRSQPLNKQARLAQRAQRVASTGIAVAGLYYLAIALTSAT